MANDKIKFSQKRIILDVEGTITPLESLKDGVVTYAIKCLKTNMDHLWNDKQFRETVDPLIKKFEENDANNTQSCPKVEGENEQQRLVNNIIHHMNLGRESNALVLMRILQGYFFQIAVESGELGKLKIFEDVIPALELWKQKEIPVYVYSSGPVELQRRFSSYTTEGDMARFITDNFDMKGVGRKDESTSYLNIAKNLGCAPSSILYITDLVSEADAASKAGLNIVIAARPGNPPLSAEDKARFKTISSFEQLQSVA